MKRAVLINVAQVFICTKFGNCSHADGTWTIEGSPEYVKQACEKSLKALGVKQIDLYYQVSLPSSSAH